MRVLIWSEGFWPHIGGVEVLTARLIEALRHRGYEFTVVTSQESPWGLPARDSYRGIPIHRFPFCTALRGGIEAVMETRAAVAQLKRTIAPDLVHIHGWGPSVFFHLCTRTVHPAPLLLTLHGGLSRVLHAIQPRSGASPNDTLLGQTLRAASWVSGVSSAALTDVLPLAPDLWTRSSVIHNGRDMPPLPPSAPADPPRVLCVGRLTPEKGVDVALRAFAVLVDRFPLARLIIAGDGPARRILEELAAALALAARVEFLGWVSPDRVPWLLNDATLVVVPSRHESFGLVALEAALAARPVVASRVEGLPEVVVDGETGLLVEPDEPEDLARAMALLLSHPERARALGGAARRRAHAQFGLEACADAYDALYQQLAKEDSNVRPV